jgi:hypothetical protein
MEGDTLAATAQVRDGLNDPVAVGLLTFSFAGQTDNDRLEVTLGTPVTQNLSTAGVVGLQTVTAAYSQGGPALPDSSASAQVNVTEATAVSAFVVANNAPDPALVGATTFPAGITLTLAATVHPAYGGDPQPTGGNVTFFLDGTRVGQAALQGGAASLDLPGITPGAHQLTAQYSGQSVPPPAISFASSPLSSPAGFSVVKTATTTTLLSSANGSAVPGQTVSFLAEVAGANGDAGQPTGTVTFIVDGDETTVPLTGGERQFFHHQPANQPR